MCIRDRFIRCTLFFFFHSDIEMQSEEGVTSHFILFTIKMICRYWILLCDQIVHVPHMIPVQQKTQSVYLQFIASASLPLAYIFSCASYSFLYPVHIIILSTFGKMFWKQIYVLLHLKLIPHWLTTIMTIKFNWCIR